MIWLTWRQFRTQAWVALAALAALTVALAATAPGLADLYRTSGMSTCATECATVADGFLSQVMTTAAGRVYWLGIGVMFAVPALIGVFWGAPLIARELETGTHRLAWNQSVTRGRWLAVKLLGVGLVGMATVGLFSLAVTWWADPIDTAYTNRLFPEIFATRGIVPIGYAAFAFVVGVTVGTIVRRTVPAMAVTLAVVAAAQLAMPFLVRPHLIPPVHVDAAFDPSAIRSFHMNTEREMVVLMKVEEPGAWVITNRTVTPTGELFTGPADPTVCGREAPPRSCVNWAGTLGLRQDAAYQPTSRFWAFQWLETAIFLAAATLLAGFCSWWVRRRLT